MQRHDYPVLRLVDERQTAWLKEHYAITPEELQNSPLTFRNEVHAAWTRYWREESLAGRGVRIVSPERQARGTRRS